MVWYKLKSFFRFYRQAGTVYNAQSEFLYQFIKQVLDTSKEYYAFKELEQLRLKLLKSNKTVEIKDFGAGSHKLSQSVRKISDMASTSLSGKATCRILFQLVEYFQCKNILELGTSLGLSSLYMASSAHDVRVTTLEGDDNISGFAKNLHKTAKASNIQVICGPFQENLQQVLQRIGQIDLAFIDGHHQEKPTIDYFNQILLNCHEHSIIIVDDIYWSEEMTKAWQSISTHPSVTLAIDLYTLGIIFFRKDLSKQYFRYIPFKFKPWRIGLFG